MIIKESHNLCDRIEYYSEIRQNLGKLYWNYDPRELIRISGIFKDCSSLYKNDYYKARKKRDVLPEACHCQSMGFPVSCGVTFSNDLAFQIQSQIENEIGIHNIHLIDRSSIIFVPFAPNRHWLTDELFICREVINGISYTFFQIEIIAEHFKDKKQLESDYLPFLLWIKCHYNNCPDKEVDFWDETNKISFEICDKPPASFPEYKLLPQNILESIYQVKELIQNEMVKFNLASAQETGYYVLLEYFYEKYTYDKSGIWKKELELFLNRCV